MELLAAINAYEAIGPDAQGVVFLDSEYVVKGLTKWLPAWERKKWKTASGKTPANLDLWWRLQRLHKRSRIKPKWIEGHAGHPLNEAVDQLAKAAAMQEAGQ